MRETAAKVSRVYSCSLFTYCAALMWVATYVSKTRVQTVLLYLLARQQQQESHYMPDPQQCLRVETRQDCRGELRY